MTTFGFRSASHRVAFLVAVWTATLAETSCTGDETADAGAAASGHPTSSTRAASSPASSGAGAPTSTTSATSSASTGEASATTSSGVGEGTIFSWDVEDAPPGGLDNGTPGQPFADVNVYGSVVSVATEVTHAGSRSIGIAYAADEDGVELKVGPFPATPSLYTRRFEYFDAGWAGNWPVGLKTARYFTRDDWGTGDQPDAYAYESEKLVWQTYRSTCDEELAYGLNCAILDLDLVDAYQPEELFGNGLPYIRTGHWYKLESWMVLNSDVDAADGVLQIWIDDVLVYDAHDVVWRSTERGVPNGVGWQTMWFGGNYSGAICGGPSTTVNRYIDDLYLSRTLDR